MEKPKVRYEASMGVYCFSPRVLEHIEKGERARLPGPGAQADRGRREVRACASDDYWLDIGRHDDYEAALDEFEEVRARLIPDE